MAADAWVMYDSFKEYLGEKVLDLNNDAFKMGLFLSTSNCATTTLINLADLTNEHASANGYARKALTVTWTKAGATTTFDCDDQVWTATGGSITARYAVIYDDTVVNDPLVCYSLLDNSPADVTATSGNTLTITINASGAFTLT